MAKIRHIAIFAKDQAKMVEFYTKTFGMWVVHRHASANVEGREGIYLSDGYINLAILPAHEKRPEGIHHFGFQVDDREEAANAALQNGAAQGPEETPKDGRFAEAFIRDPIGQRVDLCEAGWRTEPMEKKEEKPAAVTQSVTAR